jgi:hypothetical protein
MDSNDTVRLIGAVTRVDVERRRSYVTTPDTQDYFVSMFDVEPDAYGNMGLILREAVEFTPGKTRTGRPSAINVVPLNRPKTQFDNAYRDDAVVIEIQKPEVGWARRTDGTSIRWYSSNVITFGIMKIGTRFRFKPRKPKPGCRTWVATKIEIYQ